MRLPELTAATLLLLGSCTQESAPLAPSNTAMTAELHDPYFPINSGAHDGADCNACHGGFDSFEDFTCLTCHTEATTATQHAGQDQYVYVSQNCYLCHPHGEPNFNHSPYFPIDSGSLHGNLLCASCHVNPADRDTVDCISCHTDATTAPAHADVGGYQTQNSLCLRCHADAQVSPVAKHLPFDIAKGDHHLAACLTCHPQLRTDKPWGADFDVQYVDCLTCHLQPDMDSKHGGVQGYAYKSSSCLAAGCHPDGKLP